MKDGMKITGHVIAEVIGPDGVVKQRLEQHNLVSDIGDQILAKQLYSSATLPAGMKLGTATTTPSKNGAGSFIASADYVSGSAQAFDATYPKAGATANVAQYLTTWAAGVATNSGINRVSLVTDTTNAGEADATHTFATAVFGSAINKGASDVLAVTWNITIQGS